MRLRSIPFYLREPGAIVARVRRKFYDRRHPGEPWIALGAIRFLTQRLTGDMAGFEWGSGRSTLWYGKHLRSLTSVEHDESWYRTVSADLQAAEAENVRLLHVPMNPDKHNGLLHAGDDAPAYVRAIEHLPDESLDFVVVDGQYRISCAVAAQDKLRSGGLLLVDDIRTFPQLKAGLIPESWTIVCDAREGLSATVVWQKP